MPLYTQRQSISPRPGPWTGSISLYQADPALGITGISVSLTGTVDSTLAVESGEASASTFSDTVNGTVSLERPDGSAMLTATPYTGTTLQLAAADGVADYAGPAGRTVGDLVGVQQVSETLVPSATPSADGTLLVGTGLVALPVVASARVSAQGPGNVRAVFHTSLAASVGTAYQTLRPQTGGSISAGFTSGTGLIGSGQFGIDAVGSVTTLAHVQRVSDQTTGSFTTLGFSGFNPSLGTLESVNVHIDTDTVGTVQAENLDGVAGNVTIAQSAAVTVRTADGTVLDTISTPDQFHGTDRVSQNLGAYDGTLDFAGTSGVTVNGLTGSAGDSLRLRDAATLNAFLGSGRENLSLSSVGHTTIDGPGNLAVNTTLKAGATVTLSYTYLPGGAQGGPVVASGVIGAGASHTLTEDDKAQIVGPGGTLIVPNDLFGAPITVRPGGAEHALHGAFSVGAQIIGQEASGADQGPGATLLVDAGAWVDDVTLLAGGVATIDGLTVKSVVDGGLMVVPVSGAAYSTTVRSGTLLVHGGVSAGAVVQGGGLLVLDGGDIGNTTLTGGSADIRSGYATGTTIGAAGVLTLEQNAAAALVTFTNGGTLVVHSGSTVMAMQGFAVGDAIDLRDMAFGANVRGTLDAAGLHVSNGADSTTVGITGAAGFAGSDIRLSADAAGTGTLVTVAPGGLSSSGASVTSDYVGPVAGLEHQFIAISPTTVVAAAGTDNWFLHGGAGDDALQAHGGRNVLDGGGGSNFLVGGTGIDSFFVTAGSATTWSTIAGAHAGDDVTLWGVDPAMTWQDGQGAAGYTGLTLTTGTETGAGGVLTKATLAGYTSADLASGRISVQSGTDTASGLNYEYLGFH